MMQCLRLSSLFILCFLIACKAPYKSLQPVVDQYTPSALRFQPVFEKELYRCIVDGSVLFKSFHLSGVLMFKSFADGSTRVMCQNEMGMTFFDFGWDAKDSFSVHQIIPQMNRPALITTLEKDFRLVLMKQLKAADEQYFTKGDLRYHRFPLDKGSVYYIEQANALKRIENAGARKTVTTIHVGERERQQLLPDTLLIRHHNARFSIQLYKISPDAAE